MTLKSEVDRTRKPEIPRLKRWAAAAALGFVTAFGAPQLARAQDGGPDAGAPRDAAADVAVQDAAPEADATRVADAAPTDSGTRAAPVLARTPQNLITMINSLQGNTRGAEHPVNATSAEALSTTCITIFQAWEIVSRGRPADTDPMRPVYDRAIQVWGGEGQAKDALAHAFRDAIRNLRGRAQNREDCGAGAAEMDRTLAGIDQRLTEGNLEYSNSFDSCWSDVSAMRRVLRGGEAPVALTQERERVGSTADLPYIDLPLFDPGTDHYLNGFGDVQAVALEPRVTQDLILLFGNESVARDSLNALANAYIAASSPNSGAADQATAARALHDQLSRIPGDKEIWSRPGFQNAMAALARGDLRGGLGWLQGEGLFSTAYDSLNNLHQITLSQRALARFRGGLTLRLLNFRQNQEEFMEFRRGTRQGYDWDILHGDLGLHYINLLVSGYDQRYSIDRTSGRLVPFGNRVRVEGDGGAFELTPSLTWGANLGIPATMTLHGAFGYRWWSVQTDIPADSGSQTLEAKSQDPYVGLWGVHFNLLGWEGSTSRIRLDSFGVGAVGINPTVYGTFGWRYDENNHWRLNGRLTPQYVLFHGPRAEGFDTEYFFQHRFNFDLRPIDSTHQFNRDWSLMFGPGFRYSLSTEFDGADRIVHGLEPYAHATLNSQHGFSAEARFGGHFEVGGEEWQRLPASPYGMINIILTPEVWFRNRGSAESTRSGGSVRVQAGAGTQGGAEVQAHPADARTSGGSRR